MPPQISVTTKTLAVKSKGKLYTIPRTDPRYLEILQALSKNALTDDALHKIITYKEDSKGRIKVDAAKNKITIDGIEMPKELQEKFLDLKRRHKPRTYLLKFWDKLQKNPSKNSINMLYSFLNHNGHVITSTGNFTAYKAVKKDMHDHHTGKTRHIVGRVISMPREQVVEDPNQTCSAGLHVCSFAYTKEFHPGESRYLEVEIDPKDVVSVPVDYSATKMRVSRYKVMREVKGERQLKDTEALTKKLAEKIKTYTPTRQETRKYG